MSDREHRESLRDSTFLAALLVVTSAVELYLAWRYFGFLTGDDVEVLAEAFRVAGGTKYRAWDIRCLFVPDFFIAPFVWLAGRFDLTSVRAVVVFATIPSVIAAAISTVLVHAIAMRWTASTAAARAAALLFSLHWLTLGFASTVYPRTIATACVLAALWLLLRRESQWVAVAAGALCAVAFADRFSEIVFLFPILIAARRRAPAVLLGFSATVVVVVGFYDYVTWGEWFGSVRKFAALTLVESDFASRLKHQSPFWYIFNLPRWLSPLLLPLLWKARSHRVVWAFVAIPLILLSCIAHKEMRYLQGVIPYVALLAALGLTSVSQRRAAIALVAIALVWDVHGIRFLRKKTMPAVQAAEWLAADSTVNNVTMSQLWAYGDRLYFGERMSVLDVGTPPRGLAEAIRGADAVCLYETDLTDEHRTILREGGFTPARSFRNANAREVVVFRRNTPV